MGPPSSSPSLDSQNEVELAQLSKIPSPSDSYKDSGAHQSLDDDDDYEDDRDGGERALLSEDTPTRWKENTRLDPGAIWTQTSGIILETLPTLLFTTLGSLFTGELFDKISHWRAMTSVNELIAIVPVILNLKGNIEMNLSARLGTASNLGDLDTPSIRNALIFGNLALLQVQAAAVSFIAACVSFLLSRIIPGVGDGPSESLPASTRNLFLRIAGEGHHSLRRPRPTIPSGGPQSGFNEFMILTSSAMSAACLSAIILGSFMCFLVVLCRKLGRDPDNIAPPIASCLGDLVTMTFLGVMSTLLVLGAETLAPFLIIGIVVLWAIACTYVALRNEYVRALLKQGWSPLLGAMVITSASGIVLDLFVSRYDGYALLAVAFGGIPGGTGSIFASRLSTAWHVAASGNRHNAAPGSGTPPSPRHEPSPRIVMLVLLLVAIPVGLLYFLLLRLSGWLATAFAFSMLALFFLCIAIVISLIVAYYVTNYLARHGYDPDMYALPIHSAILDLVGQILLVSSFELASALGLDVRSHTGT